MVVFTADAAASAAATAVALAALWLAVIVCHLDDKKGKHFFACSFNCCSVVLLAAFCLARSSDQFHAWLVGHKVFGSVILDWQTRGAIGQKAKRMATASIVLVFAISLFLGVPAYLLGAQIIVLGGVLLFIWSRPTS